MYSFALTVAAHGLFICNLTDFAEWIIFPDDPAVLDVKKALGAKGDGITDDTEALQRALDISTGRDKVDAKTFGNRTRVLFLPNGTYRLTRSLIVKSGIGP